MNAFNYYYNTSFSTPLPVQYLIRALVVADGVQVNLNQFLQIKRYDQIFSLVHFIII